MLSVSAPPPPVPPAESAATPWRLRQVDSLRAVAAGMVMWTHFAEILRGVSAPAPTFLGFLETFPAGVNLGTIGVMIFFAISGFVICRSFGGTPRGAARRFLIRRFCRLYPVFWVSMLGGALIWWLQRRELSWSLIAATATMLPGRFGQPYLIGVYWTLEVELAFYAVCLGLFLTGWLERRAVLGGLALVLMAVSRTVYRYSVFFGVRHYILPGAGGTWMVSLGMMFWGATFRLVYDETGGFRRRPFARPATWLLALFTLALIDVYDPRVKQALWQGHLGTLLVEMGSSIGILIFTVWVAGLRVENRVMTFLGAISYSLYLFHPMVLYLICPLIVHAEARGLPPPPLWVGLLACTVLTVAVAAVTYRWIERPAMAFGKRWVGATREKPALSPEGAVEAG